MATNLPHFAAFRPHVEENTAGLRWKKWLDTFDNLLTALDITDYKKKKSNATTLCRRRNLRYI